jgi:cobalt-zinc-cadmium efflux system membrane fusion protein
MPRAHVSVVCLTIALSACHEARRTAQAASAPVASDEVRIDPASGKLAYIRVETPTIRRERVIAALPGQVIMNEDRSVRVLAPVTGRVVSLDAAEGDHVAAGSPLAHIVSGDMAQAASDVVKARAAEAQARAALLRVEDLYAHKVAPLKDVEQARSDAAQSQAELARARSRLTALGADPAADEIGGTQYVLRAPISGVVVARAVNPGAEVRPDAATPLFTITSLDVVWLAASVYQRDLAAIHPGVTLRFVTDAAPDRHFDATVTYVAGALDPQTHTALVRARLPNPGHLLRPLETGTAEVLAPSATPLLTVPARALITHGSGMVVYVESGPGRYVRRPVVVGDDDGMTAVVLQGLAPTDRVVVDGSLLLEGESVRGA